jgi:hypothetical protein
MACAAYEPLWSRSRHCLGRKKDGGGRLARCLVYDLFVGLVKWATTEPILVDLGFVSPVPGLLPLSCALTAAVIEGRELVDRGY